MCAAQQFLLPPRLDAYLATLSRLYSQNGERLLEEIVVNGNVTIEEGREYDDWDGGTYGHAVTLCVTESLFLRLIEEKHNIEERIRADLNRIDNSRNEHVCAVFLQMDAVAEDDWRLSSDAYRSSATTPTISAKTLERLWGSSRVRVFLSHKASIRAETSAIKNALARCGVAAFVAHEDIEPTEEWQREIESALFSMDALVALLTDDFHGSKWTDQEVGVALGRGVPLIAVRLGCDPYGLMGSRQGLGGCTLSDPETIAIAVFGLLALRLQSQMFECALAVYAESTSFHDSGWKAEHLLAKFESLGPDDVRRVHDAYHANIENLHSFRGMDFLEPLFEKWTGESWHVVGNVLEPKDKASVYHRRERAS